MPEVLATPRGAQNCSVLTVTNIERGHHPMFSALVRAPHAAGYPECAGSGPGGPVQVLPLPQVMMVLSLRMLAGQRVVILVLLIRWLLPPCEVWGGDSGHFLPLAPQETLQPKSRVSLTLVFVLCHFSYFMDSVRQVKFFF